MCKLCRGSGSLVCFPEGRPQWWNCCACDGDGSDRMYSEPFIKLNAGQSKMARKFGKRNQK